MPDKLIGRELALRHGSCTLAVACNSGIGIGDGSTIVDGSGALYRRVNADYWSELTIRKFTNYIYHQTKIKCSNHTELLYYANQEYWHGPKIKISIVDEPLFIDE